MIQQPIISDELLKINSPITSNTDIQEFIPYILIAQEIYILPIIGEPLMHELKEQVKNNNLTEDNSNLIAKIAPSLSFYTVYQGLPFHWASIVNKGLTVRESENSKGVDIKDVAQLRAWVLKDAEILRDNLIRFLCECQLRYPLWRPRHKCCDDIIKEGSTEKDYNFGFYFPKKGGGCGCR